MPSAGMKLVRDLMRAGAGLPTDENPQAVEFAILEMVRRRLDQYIPPTYPHRPAHLPGDTQVAALLRARKRGKRLQRAEEETLYDWATWEVALCKAEDDARGNAEVLMWVAERYAVLGLQEHSVEVARFLAEEYGINVPPYLGRTERHALTLRVCSRTDWLPGWMRARRRPPRGWDKQEFEDEPQLRIGEPPPQEDRRTGGKSEWE